MDKVSGSGFSLALVAGFCLVSSAPVSPVLAGEKRDTGSEPYFKKLQDLPDFAALRSNWIRSDLGGDKSVPREASLELWLAHEYLDQTAFRTPVVIEYFTAQDLPAAQKLRSYLIGTSAGAASPRGRTRSGNENRVILLESLKRTAWAGWVVVRPESREIPRKPTPEMARIFKALEWDLGTQGAEATWLSQSATQHEETTGLNEGSLSLESDDRRGWQDFQVFAGLENGMSARRQILSGDAASPSWVLAQGESHLTSGTSDLPEDRLKISQSAILKSEGSLQSSQMSRRPKASGMSFRPEYRTEVLSVDRTTGNELKDLDARAGWIGGRVGADWTVFQRPVLELGVHGDYGLTYRAITESAEQGEARSWNTWAYANLRANSSKFGIPSLRVGVGAFSNTRESKNPDVLFLPKLSGWMSHGALSLRIDEAFSLDISGTYFVPKLDGSSLFDVGASIRQRFYSNQGRNLDGRFGFQISAADAPASGSLSASQETWSNVYFGLIAEL